jgi:hypothetical protein
MTTDFLKEDWAQRFRVNSMKTALLTPVENHAHRLITGGREFMPEIDIFFRMQTFCRYDGRFSEGRLSPRFRVNSIETALLTPLENHAHRLITGGREFMPEIDIFFRMQTFCRYDGRLSEGRLSPEGFGYWNGPSDTRGKSRPPSYFWRARVYARDIFFRMQNFLLTTFENCARRLITGGREFMTEMDIFFRMQSLCRYKDRLSEGRLSPKVFVNSMKTSLLATKENHAHRLIYRGNLCPR